MPASTDLISLRRGYTMSRSRSSCGMQPGSASAAAISISSVTTPACTHACVACCASAVHAHAARSLNKTAVPQQSGRAELHKQSTCTAEVRAQGKARENVHVVGLARHDRAPLVLHVVAGAATCEDCTPACAYRLQLSGILLLGRPHKQQCPPVCSDACLQETFNSIGACRAAVSKVGGPGRRPE
jgi:hypothetical protein